MKIKKIVASILSVIMLLCSVQISFAAEGDYEKIKNYINSIVPDGEITINELLNTLKVGTSISDLKAEDIRVRRNTSLVYTSTLDMAKVREKYNSLLTIINLLDDDLKTIVNNSGVSGKFTIDIIYDSSLNTEDLTENKFTALNEEVFDTENVSITHPTDTSMRIEVGIKPEKTVSSISVDKLTDVSYQISNVKPTTTGGPYAVKVSMNGYVAFSVENQEYGRISFSSADATRNVEAYTSSGGLTATYYTITFDTQGGGNLDSVRVIRNDTVSEPAEPTREGYIFDGWFTDKDCTTEYDFDTKVTKNITLYAGWTEEKDPVEPIDPTEPDKWENPFADVDEDDWYYDNVRYAYENKLFSGVSDTEFAPNEEMTRAMLVTVLYRAEDEPAVVKNIPFVDIDMNEYYTNAVIWAAENEIVNGYDENTFGPNDKITREQIASIIKRYADFKGVDTTQTGSLSQFTDETNISDWARENVSWGVGVGLISGKGNGILDPRGNATRAEVAAILQRFLEK